MEGVVPVPWQWSQSFSPALLLWLTRTSHEHKICMSSRQKVKKKATGKEKKSLLYSFCSNLFLCRRLVHQPLHLGFKSPLPLSEHASPILMHVPSSESLSLVRRYRKEKVGRWKNTRKRTRTINASVDISRTFTFIRPRPRSMKVRPVEYFVAKVARGQWLTGGQVRDRHSSLKVVSLGCRCRLFFGRFD